MGRVDSDEAGEPHIHGREEPHFEETGAVGGEQTTSIEIVDDLSEDELRRRARCLYCFTNVRNVVILPCGHVLICISCKRDLLSRRNDCPVCFKNFTSLKQIF